MARRKSQSAAERTRTGLAQRSRARAATAPRPREEQPAGYEGLQHHIPQHLDLPEIESWEFLYPGSATELHVDIPEFTCICPKTGLPDFARIVIEYRPGSLCLELKSLKEYMLAYRDLGIFHEHVVNRILADCAKACKPVSMTITGIFNSRGGILTTAKATLEKGKRR